MKNTNTTPLYVYGYSPLAVQITGHRETRPATFEYSPDINRYTQGGDHNKAKRVKGITTCAGRITGLYMTGENENDPVIIDSPLCLITPKKGDFKLIDSLLSSFTACDKDAESEEQKRIILTWIQHAAMAVYNGMSTGAPVLVLMPQDVTLTSAGAFIVENIIKPILGGMSADFSRYYPCSGETGHTPLKAQGESACLLYDPAACFTSCNTARKGHLVDLFGKINRPFSSRERIIDSCYNESATTTFTPIYRAIIETCQELPFIDPNNENHRSSVCVLHVNKPTLGSSPKALDALAAECREQLPAFIHFLLNDMQRNTPKGYISPSAYRYTQRIRFIKEKAAENNTRIIYKLATILILSQEEEGKTKSASRMSTFSLFSDITKAAKVFNMPLPAKDWSPDILQGALDDCLQKYPAYISSDSGGGWIINLPAIEKDILLS